MMNLFRTLALSVISVILFGCAEPHELVTEMSYKLDPSCEMKRPAIEANAVPVAIAMWAEFGVNLVEEGEADPSAHPLTICFVDEIVYDTGYDSEYVKAVGRTWKDKSGSKILIQNGMPYMFTTAVIAHEIAHVVTWSSEHSEEDGVFDYNGGGPIVEWTQGDIDYFESLGLEYLGHIDI